MQDEHEKARLARLRPDEVICDRCGRVPGVARDKRTPFCWICMHECTFTRGELVGVRTP